jgi:hydroxyacid-oxoacid transhydrogenase
VANDTAFQMTASNMRFGPGVTREVGMDLSDMGVRRVMVLTDPCLAKLPPVATVLESLEREKLEFALFDRVRIEPTDASFEEAIAFARAEPFDAFVAVGGGSTIDTAKAADLYSTHPADLLDYVNPPIGQGRPVPGPLKPLVAIPTTAGTGSESTGVAILDLAETHVKTGIASAHLKPKLGLVDPENTRTLPPMVAASTGLDVLCHALESYTALPYDRRPAPERPAMRPPYQGANPISDLWALEAIRLGARYLARAVADPEDEEARSAMLLGSAYAGIGFGHAGVHVPHAMAYPVAGMVRSYRPPSYPPDRPLIPHGMAVVLNAPAAFRFTAPTCPERHLRGAELLGADVTNARAEDAGKILSAQIAELMEHLVMPNGLAAVGYTRDDIPALADGAVLQQRILKLSPTPIGRDELAALFEDALVAW